MKRYREPSFQERIANADRVRGHALAQLRARPPLDESIVTQRAVRRLTKEVADAERRSATKLAADEIKVAVQAQTAGTASFLPPAKPIPTGTSGNA